MPIFDLFNLYSWICILFVTFRLGASISPERDPFLENCGVDVDHMLSISTCRSYLKFLIIEEMNRLFPIPHMQFVGDGAMLDTGFPPSKEPILKMLEFILHLVVQSLQISPTRHFLVVNDQSGLKILFIIQEIVEFARLNYSPSWGRDGTTLYMREDIMDLSPSVARLMQHLDELDAMQYSVSGGGWTGQQTFDGLIEVPEIVKQSEMLASIPNEKALPNNRNQLGLSRKYKLLYPPMEEYVYKPYCDSPPGSKEAVFLEKIIVDNIILDAFAKSSITLVGTQYYLHRLAAARESLSLLEEHRIKYISRKKAAKLYKIEDFLRYLKKLRKYLEIDFIPAIDKSGVIFPEAGLGEEINKVSQTLEKIISKH